MWERKNELQHKYGGSASVYERRYRDVQRRKFEFIAEFLESQKRILEVGCGSGFFLDNFNEESEIFVGVDFSLPMLERVRERDNDVYLILADADYLPFKKNTFDIVISLTLLQNMPDPGFTIIEMKRVLRDDGIMIMTTLEKKHSVSDLEDLVQSAGLTPVKIGSIPGSEDIFCVAEEK